MPYNQTTLPIPLDGTGTEIPALNISDGYSLYLITGTVTTTGNYAIVSTGTPQLGTTFNFKYRATTDITTNSNTFSIFGVSLNQTQLNSKIDIECFYNGSTWTVDIQLSGDQASVTSANIVSIDPDQIVGTQGVMTFDVEFLTATSTYRYYFPNDGFTHHIHLISLYVAETIAGTDNGTLSVTTSAGAISNFTGVLIGAGSTVGTQYSPGSPADHEDVVTGGYIQISTSKVTPGGKIAVSVLYELQ